MAHGTQNLHGHGFILGGVPEYLDEGCKRAPHSVRKSKASAVRKAASEAEWAKVQVSDQVEDVVAEQIEGFPGYWFVVWVYTDEQAAKTKATKDRLLAIEKARLVALAERT